ncbi:sulfite exporter TauE/SafE family protein [Rubrivirga marina]|uniref:Probable membrane transporter protein n=1 Tax=Rubrivirga marina TaxID=1196024 RepID=A0A271IWB7_9BACT|nr:sulfite exporter TauE/SafE family protein [Rubrivirga marina]PAP75531.1 permease [Rubrivirga marina]
MSQTVLLVLVALIGGIAITLLGPGGIFVTVALHALGYSAATVAGTASAAFVGTGIVGSAAYWRSGELAAPGVRRDALVLTAASVLGALGGSALNAVLDRQSFGVALGVFVGATGLLVFARQRGLLKPATALDAGSRRAQWLMLGLGVAVGVPGGALGVGGPVLAVPLLVLCGVPMLTAVAMAQVQSVAIAGFATLGYVVRGTVDWPLALLIGVPLVIGTVIGWRLAQKTPTERLTTLLATVLLVIGVYLVATAV